MEIMVLQKKENFHFGYGRWGYRAKNASTEVEAEKIKKLWEKEYPIIPVIFEPLPRLVPENLDKICSR